ncbi:MAG: DUF1203 domain-containing protein [Pseudomonadota bacterium]
MSFQIHALAEKDFQPLFGLSDIELKGLNARRETVTAKPGVPCRISLSDAEVGESVILVNYEHQPADSPYRAKHAIYVRNSVRQATPEVGEVPDVIRSRLISLRVFDDSHQMIAAEVTDGALLSDEIATQFSNPAAAYIHLHFAKPGCFAALVTRSES